MRFNEEITSVEIDKKYLQDYSKLREEIECECSRLEMLNAKAFNVSAKPTDGMPRGSSVTSDKMAMYLSHKSDIEERLKTLIQLEKEKKEIIERAINERLEFPTEKMVIRLRYIDGGEWKEICNLMYSKKRDYFENEDKYMRRTFRVHGNALEKMRSKPK